MKILLLVLLPLFSFAQNEEWVGYSDLPEKIIAQVDSGYFKNALRIIESDTIYLVECRRKNWCFDTVYKSNGEIVDMSKYRYHSYLGYAAFTAAFLTIISLIFFSHSN
jgi:hypothetical protein